MGRIESIRYGSDGIACSAEIRANAGKYSKYIRRAVKLIHVLVTTLSGPEDIANVSVFIFELNSKQSRRHSADGNALDSGSKGHWFEPPTTTKLAKQNQYSNKCTLSNGLLESGFGPN